MEFSVFRQVLIRALGHMQSIVEKRATLPILMNVKLEVADDLILSATNVDLELVEHVAADITLGGKTTVPVQMLYDIVRKLPDDAEISFKQSGDQLVVSSGRAVFRLPTLPAENFPAMAGSNLTTKFQMTTGDLLENWLADAHPCETALKKGAPSYSEDPEWMATDVSELIGTVLNPVDNKEN